MSPVDFSVNFFVALFALIDPVGNVPLFAAATIGAAAGGRRRLALYISLFSLAFLSVFFFTGLGILKFFGISLPAFRIAGGVLLFLTGLEMARDDFSARFDDEGASVPQTSREYARSRFERLVVPFAMPLLIGPGAISTVVIYSSEAGGLGALGYAGGLAAIVAVSASIFACFALTEVLSRLLGRIGMTIVVRVLGLILVAMAVQFVIAGVAAATHDLVRHDAVAPYHGRT